MGSSRRWTPATPAERAFGDPWYPDFHSLGELRLPRAATGAVLGRHLSFNSYAFRVILWKPGTARPERRRIAERIAEVNGAVELSRRTSSVRIRRPHTDVRRHLAPEIREEVLRALLRPGTR